MSTPPLLRQAMPAGDLLAISGQIGFDDGVLVSGGIAPQTARALWSLKEVRATHALTVADVVKANVYLTTMDDYTAMNAEYTKTFSENPPARTAVAVHQLPFCALVELEAWALGAV